MEDYEEGQCSDQDEFAAEYKKNTFKTNPVWSEILEQRRWNSQTSTQQNYHGQNFQRGNRSNKNPKQPNGRFNPYSKGYEQYLKVDTKFDKYYCDRCDRGFKFENQLAEHNLEHIHCKIDGCTFFAHPKIVQKHIEMQHESGLASKVMGINTLEDIQKWKAERQKNYPTTKVVAEKIASRAERKKRGEALGKTKPTLGQRKGPDHHYNPKQRCFESKQVINVHTKKRKRQKDGQKVVKKVTLKNPFEYKDNFSDSENRHYDVKSDDENEENKGKLPGFCGTVTWLGQFRHNQSVTDLNEIHISDDEEEENSTIEGKQVVAALGGLTSLICAYGSDSEQENEPAPLLSKPEIPVFEGTAIKPMPIKFKAEGVDKLKGKMSKENTIHPVQKIRPQRLTLLQKLLQDEIRHERNVILQCVHYTLDQQFFGVK